MKLASPPLTRLCPQLSTATSQRRWLVQHQALGRQARPHVGGGVAGGQVRHEELPGRTGRGCECCVQEHALNQWARTAIGLLVMPCTATFPPVCPCAAAGCAAPQTSETLWRPAPAHACKRAITHGQPTNVAGALVLLTGPTTHMAYGLLCTPGSCPVWHIAIG